MGLKQGQCKRENILYELKCEECNSRYIGESSRNASTRITEHHKEATNKSKNSIIWRHTQDKHTNTKDIPTFSAKIIKSFHKGALHRQIAEGVHINQASRSHRPIINGKTEWNRNEVFRLEISR